jgi:HK97 family phage portal protein
MGGISAGIRSLSLRAEDKVHRLENFFPFYDMIGTSRSTAGQDVTPESALTLDSYFACIRNASEDLGKMPLIPYELMKPRGRNVAFDHHLYDILLHEPNEDMSAMNFKEAVNGMAMGRGGGFAAIEWTPGGNAESLHPIHTSRVRIKRDEQKRLVYDVRADTLGQEVVRYQQRDMIHMHGFGAVGTSGYVISALAAASIGLGLAGRDYSSKFFENDATPRTLIKYPEGLSEAARKAHHQSFSEGLKGDNRNIIGTLYDGIQLEQLSVTPEDALLIEQGNFTISSMARWFRMPPHKIQHLINATFSNITEQNLEYVIDCLDSWATRWEQEIMRKLFTKAERKRFMVDFDFKKLLRGDPVKRAQVERIHFNIGAITQDEIRDENGRNPLPDGMGEEVWVPKNMKRISEPEPEPEDNPPGTGFENTETAEPGASREALVSAHRPLLVEAISRVVTKGVKATERKRKQLGDEDYEAWVTEFFVGQHHYFNETVNPPALSLATLLGLSDADSRDIVDVAAKIYQIRLGGEVEDLTDCIIDGINQLLESS